MGGHSNGTIETSGWMDSKWWGKRRLPRGSDLRDKLWKQLAVNKVNEGGVGEKEGGRILFFLKNKGWERVWPSLSELWYIW